MIDLETIQGYFAAGTVFVTEHAVERFKQRGIFIRDVKAAIFQVSSLSSIPKTFRSQAVSCVVPQRVISCFMSS